MNLSKKHHAAGLLQSDKDAQGILRSYNQRLVGLSPGQVTQVSTGLRPGSGQVQLSIASIETVQGG